MSKLSTFNYLVNSYNAGKNEVEILQYIGFPSENNSESTGCYEPSQRSIDAILNFASQYDVLKLNNVGVIELNLN
jgi:hypothetical protein